MTQRPDAAITGENLAGLDRTRAGRGPDPWHRCVAGEQARGGQVYTCAYMAGCIFGPLVLGVGDSAARGDWGATLSRMKIGFVRSHAFWVMQMYELEERRRFSGKLVLHLVIHVGTVRSFSGWDKYGGFAPKNKVSFHFYQPLFIIYSNRGRLECDWVSSYTGRFYPSKNGKRKRVAPTMSNMRQGQVDNVIDGQ